MLEKLYTERKMQKYPICKTIHVKTDHLRCWFSCEISHTDGSDTNINCSEGRGLLLCSYVDPCAHHIIGSKDLTWDWAEGKTNKQIIPFSSSLKVTLYWLLTLFFLTLRTEWGWGQSRAHVSLSSSPVHHSIFSLLPSCLHQGGAWVCFQFPYLQSN